MQYRRRLRSRIVLSFLIFGTLLSVLFALSTMLLQNYLEDQLIGATLEKELADYVNSFGSPTVVEPHTRIRATLRPATQTRLPAAFRELSAACMT
jgi:hypothetical protein